MFFCVGFSRVAVGEDYRADISRFVKDHVRDDFNDDVVHLDLFVYAHQGVVLLVRLLCPLGFDFDLIVSNFDPFFTGVRVAQVCFDGGATLFMVIANVCVRAVGETSSAGQ